MPTELAPGEVHVWCRTTGGLDEGEIARLVERLSPEERAICERFRFDRDRRDYAAAHALLRSALSRYAEIAPESWEFEQEPGGKPRLAPKSNPPCLFFNLSHTHGLVACAISASAEIGIDVERADRYVQDVAERFYSERENERLRGCESESLRAQHFIELWTLKEAYVKALGFGLSHPLNTIEFEVAPVIRFRPPQSVDPREWTFTLGAPAPGYCLAVAARHGRASIRILGETSVVGV
jgi:4'-phosphopantetheinyl transferase